MLVLMGRSRRIQIPVDEPELALVKAAATRAGLPVAEWARSILRQEARRELGEADLGPREALDLLFSLAGPVDEVQRMIEESVAGRLG